MRRPERLAVLGVAVLCAAAAFGADAGAQPPNPFALGGIEGAGARPTGGITAFVMAKQAEFSRAMTAAARAIRSDWTSVWTLAGIAFAYGVFHAAGPGHGKAVVASYVIANEAQLKRGVAVATAAAVVQGLVAFALVGAVAVLIGGTRRTLTASVNMVETASYAAIAVFGAWLVLRKARAMLALWRGSGGEACAHVHMPDPTRVSRLTARDAAVAAVAAGVRPCSGAILILVFTLAQGVFWAGGLAVAAMAAGVALTTSTIAAVAVYFKAFAVRMASGDSALGRWLLAAGELAAALFVTAFGLLMLFGLWASVGGA